MEQPVACPGEGYQLLKRLSRENSFGIQSVVNLGSRPSALTKALTAPELKNPYSYRPPQR